MRIVVIDIAADTGGAMTVLKDFYHYVSENNHDDEWVFILSDKYLEERDNIKILVRKDIKRNKIHRLLFDSLLGRFYINRLNPDVVFSLQNTTVSGLKCKQIVYLHQPLPFQKERTFSFFKKDEFKLAFYQKLIGSFIKKSIRNASKIIVQTSWMKNAIVEQCRIKQDRIERVMPSVRQIKQVENFDTIYRSFFYPTSDLLYKNNNIIYEACSLLDERNYKYDFYITLDKPNTPVSNNIHFIGRLSYEEVIKKYQCCTLVHPSYIETFGYPLAEARKAGTIILSSDTLFSREILKDYENAYYFDYKDSYSLFNLLRDVIEKNIIWKSIKNNHQNETDSWKEVCRIIYENR